MMAKAVGNGLLEVVVKNASCIMVPLPAVAEP